MSNLGYPERPRTLTDKIVEREVSRGGEFRIARDQDSLTQGPGGVDIISRVDFKGNKSYTLVPRTDSIPQTEDLGQVIWRRC